MSLASIDSALFTALAATGHAGTLSADRPFALVARHTGPWTREALQHVCGQYPAALLRANGASYAPSTPGTILGETEMRAPEGWSVLVALEDPRSADDATQGADGVPGLLTLIDRVLGVLNDLPIATAQTAARAMGWRWVPELARGAVVTAAEVIFVVERVPPAATVALLGEPWERADGDLGPPDAPRTAFHTDLDD